MARRLTAASVEPRTNQAVIRWMLTFNRNADASKTLNSAKTMLRYVTSDLHEDASQANKMRTTIVMDDWPPAMRAAIRTLHDMIVQHADTLGLFDPGVDSEDISP